VIKKLEKLKVLRREQNTAAVFVAGDERQEEHLSNAAQGCHQGKKKTKTKRRHHV
jgi:hypothetical protein